jgi:hypothetical protein
VRVAAGAGDLPHGVLRFDSDLLARVDAAARRQGISRTAWLHVAASKALERSRANRSPANGRQGERRQRPSREPPRGRKFDSITSWKHFPLAALWKRHKSACSTASAFAVTAP